MSTVSLAGCVTVNDDGEGQRRWTVKVGRMRLTQCAQGIRTSKRPHKCAAATEQKHNR